MDGSVDPLKEGAPLCPVTPPSSALLDTLIAAAVAAGLLLSRRYHYLLFHSLVEGFSVVVACSVFLLAWNARRMLQDDYLLFLGIAYLAVGGVDLVHTLAYSGMGVFPGYGADLPTQLWIAARYLEALSLVAATTFLGRRLPRRPTLFVYLVGTAALLGAIFTGRFPSCFVEGQGLTAFKVASEYVISGLLLASGLLLWRRRDLLSPRILHLVLVSIALTVASEMSFTLYEDTYGLWNMVGHLLKLASFFLVYRAIVETGLMRPYELLFRELKEKEEELERQRAGLAEAVEARTAELLETQGQLLRSQKLEAVARFAGGIAHDFNNMLSVILGSLDLATSATDPEDPLNQDLARAVNAATRSATLTRQLLAFSRQQPLEPRVVDLNEIVRGLAEMLDRLTGEDVELLVDLPAELGRVRADPGQIDQILMNLVVNARDAMPDGGRLTLETADVELDAPYAREHPEVTPGPHVMVAVSDTGTGMDQETRERIFDPYFTTKELGRGTGLGLAIVHGIVKQSGGHIWVYSEVGSGTTFKIYLPRVDAPVEVESAHAGAGAQRGEGQVILVVEDEELLRELMKRILGRAGYEVLLAEDGEQALDLLEGQRGSVHLLLSDLILPGLSGRELAVQVGTRYPRTRVALMSGYTAGEATRNGTLAPGVRFLPKPITVQNLRRFVAEVLATP